MLWTNIPDVGGYAVVDIVRWLVMCSIHLSGSPIFLHFAKQQPNLEVNSFSSVPKGHFTLRPLVERTNDSKNLIGGEQKFVCFAFALEVNGLQNTYMVVLFGSLVPKIFPLEESLFAIFMETQILLK
jgi:hypothetical protein